MQSVSVLASLVSELAGGQNTKGGSAVHPAISKILGPMNLKFCRVLEACLKVLEM